MLVATQNHGDFLQRSVASSFANTIHRHFYLTGSIEHTSKCVGRCQTQVVVAMGRDDGLVDAVDMINKILDLLTVLLRQAITRGIGDVDNGGSCLDDSLDHTCQILVVGTAGILGIELYVLDEPFRIFHSLYGTFDDLFTIAVELVLDVEVTGAYTCMDALMLRILQGLYRHIDVFLHSTRKRTDSRPRNGL